MNDKYLNNLRKNDLHKGGVCKINDNTKDMVIENPIRIEFNNLYPKLLIHLYDNNILKKFNINVDPQLIERVKIYFKIDMNETQRKVEKAWLNSIWRYELKEDSSQIFDLFNQYMTAFYTDLTNNYPNWYYIDTDRLYLNEPISNNDVPDILKDYHSENYNYAFFYSEKRLVLYNTKEDYQIRGFYQTDKRSSDILNTIQNHIKKKDRNKILNYLSEFFNI